MRLIELNAPDMIIANEIVMLWQSGLLLFPQDLGGTFMKWMEENERRRVGLCTEIGCSSEKLGSGTYPSMCFMHARAQEQADAEYIAEEKADTKERAAIALLKKLEAGKDKDEN